MWAAVKAYLTRLNVACSILFLTYIYKNIFRILKTFVPNCAHGHIQVKSTTEEKKSLIDQPTQFTANDFFPFSH